MARTDEAKWKRIVAAVKAGSKSGKPQSKKRSLWSVKSKNLMGKSMS